MTLEISIISWCHVVCIVLVIIIMAWPVRCRTYLGTGYAVSAWLNLKCCESEINWVNCIRPCLLILGKYQTRQSCGQASWCIVQKICKEMERKQTPKGMHILACLGFGFLLQVICLQYVSCVYCVLKTLAFVTCLSCAQPIAMHGNLLSLSLIPGRGDVSPPQSSPGSSSCVVGR